MFCHKPWTPGRVVKLICLSPFFGIDTGLVFSNVIGTARGALALV